MFFLFRFVRAFFFFFSSSLSVGCIAKRHILTQASKLGLLSKLEAAGLTLKDVEKLLPLGEQKAPPNTPSVIIQDCIVRTC